MAGIVLKTYTPKDNLEQTAGMLEKNLNKKEEFIKGLLTRESIDNIKKFSGNDTVALKGIKDITTDNRVWIYTYQNNRIKFWSGVKILPEDPLHYKEGSSFISEPNGYYEAVKKTEGNFCVMFFIPVKLTYPYQNRYLRNAFDRDVLTDDNIEIADFTDKNIAAIHNIDHHYLFSVKLKPNTYNARFTDMVVLLLALGLLTLCTFIHSLCNYIAEKGYIIWSFAALAGFIVLARFVNLYFHWPYLPFQFDLLSPRLYASSALFPSLGDFCVNIFAFCWFAAFVYQHRHQIVKGNPGKGASYAITIGCMLFLLGVATGLLRLFYGLVINSSINFDVTNVFNLTVFSMVGVLILCFSFLLFYLLNDVALTIIKRCDIPDSHKMTIFIIGTLGITVVTIVLHDLSFFYILAGIFIAIRAYSVWFGNGKLTSGALVSLIVVCSVISSTKLNHFLSLKELDLRKVLAQKLEISDDINADYQFLRIEKNIAHDEELKRYLTDSISDESYIQNYFQKTYFDGYLSKYTFQIHAFNEKGEPVWGDRNYVLNDFKDMVIYSSFKVSDYFYRENENFGFQRYFAILPVMLNNKSIGTVIIDLKSKPLYVSNNFPELLIDGDARPADEFKDYSYAYYSDGKLLNQKGKYVYSLQNREFKGALKKFLFTTTSGKTSITDNDQPWYNSLINYSHLIYQPGPRYLIVVSKEEDVLQRGITSITFFFVILLTFSAVIFLMLWSWDRIRIFNIKSDSITWGFKINLDKILYKNRIQFSVIFTVVITLLIVGVITFRSISSQYRVKQDLSIHDRLSRIATVFESGLQKGVYKVNSNDQVKFNEFADTYQTDLTLYNSEGIPILTTQPKIFDDHLIARRMNGKAYINLVKLQKSEFLNDEFIGESGYKAAYVPIRSALNATVAYLQLPYFANEEEYNISKGALLNAMINIYAVVFIAIGLFAIIIARQITAPLNFIQYNLSKTMYGKKNEPIKWDRDDEIGALVKEYNKMIAALEQSAQRLAQSERESAWREMAKQVAHEIKNPLTPLKLGLQLLDKSWKDKDPKFDQKFERFSKSFVEQIESLSSIASEFSAFAKMPDTRLERINIFEMIGQAVTIFKHMDNVSITFAPGPDFYVNADRDQLLRCFNNLLKNSIEAVPPDRAVKIDISHGFNNNNILITLADNGNGIPGNLREKIFEPNFTTKSSGTGLGLAFVKNSIENAGGNVWFETIIGSGTTFYLNLPKA